MKNNNYNFVFINGSKWKVEKSLPSGYSLLENNGKIIFLKGVPNEEGEEPLINQENTEQPTPKVVNQPQAKIQSEPESQKVQPEVKPKTKVEPQKETVTPSGTGATKTTPPPPTKLTKPQVTANYEHRQKAVQDWLRRHTDRKEGDPVAKPEELDDILSGKNIDGMPHESDSHPSLYHDDVSRQHVINAQKSGGLQNLSLDVHPKTKKVIVSPVKHLTTKEAQEQLSNLNNEIKSLNDLDLYDELFRSHNIKNPDFHFLGKSNGENGNSIVAEVDHYDENYKKNKKFCSIKFKDGYPVIKKENVDGDPKYTIDMTVHDTKEEAIDSSKRMVHGENFDSEDWKRKEPELKQEDDQEETKDNTSKEEINEEEIEFLNDIEEKAHKNEMSDNDFARFYLYAKQKIRDILTEEFSKSKGKPVPIHDLVKKVKQKIQSSVSSEALEKMDFNLNDFSFLHGHLHGLSRSIPDAHYEEGDEINFQHFKDSVRGKWSYKGEGQDYSQVPLRTHATPPLKDVAKVSKNLETDYIFELLKKQEEMGEHFKNDSERGDFIKQIHSQGHSADDIIESMDKIGLDDAEKYGYFFASGVPFVKPLINAGHDPKDILKDMTMAVNKYKASYAFTDEMRHIYSDGELIKTLDNCGISGREIFEDLMSSSRKESRNNKKLSFLDKSHYNAPRVIGSMMEAGWDDRRIIRSTPIDLREPDIVSALWQNGWDTERIFRQSDLIGNSVESMIDAHIPIPNIYDGFIKSGEDDYSYYQAIVRMNKTPKEKLNFLQQSGFDNQEIIKNMTFDNNNDADTLKEMGWDRDRIITKFRDKFYEYISKRDDFTNYDIQDYGRRVWEAMPGSNFDKVESMLFHGPDGFEGEFSLGTYDYLKKIGFGDQSIMELFAEAYARSGMADLGGNFNFLFGLLQQGADFKGLSIYWMNMMREYSENRNDIVTQQFLDRTNFNLAPAMMSSKEMMIDFLKFSMAPKNIYEYAANAGIPDKEILPELIKKFSVTDLVLDNYDVTNSNVPRMDLPEFAEMLSEYGIDDDKIFESIVKEKGDEAFEDLLGVLQWDIEYCALMAATSGFPEKEIMESLYGSDLDSDLKDDFIREYRSKIKTYDRERGLKINWRPRNRI
jgi:hypothetical protein